MVTGKSGFGEKTSIAILFLMIVHSEGRLNLPNLNSIEVPCKGTYQEMFTVKPTMMQEQKLLVFIGNYILLSENKSNILIYLAITLKCFLIWKYCHVKYMNQCIFHWLELEFVSRIPAVFNKEFPKWKLVYRCYALCEVLVLFITFWRHPPILFPLCALHLNNCMW